MQSTPREERHGTHRTDTREPGQRRADHVPRDRRRDGRRARRDRPRAAGGRSRARLACTSIRSRRSASRSSAARCDSGWGASGSSPARATSSSFPPACRTTSPTPATSDALVRVEMRPALQMERLFETAVALAEEGRTMLRRHPEAARARSVHRASSRTRSGRFPPRWLQRLVLAPLAWIARRRRHTGDLPPSPAAWLSRWPPRFTRSDATRLGRVARAREHGGTETIYVMNLHPREHRRAAHPRKRHHNPVPPLVGCGWLAGGLFSPLVAFA